MMRVRAVLVHTDKILIEKEKQTMRISSSIAVHAARLVCVLAVGVALAARPASGSLEHVSSPFQGVKANTGTVTHSTENGMQILTLSDDFKVPDAPAPHWQVVDSKGNVYLLNRLQVKGDRFNRQIVVPAYVKDIAKVQIWCAWAETLLGEARFPEPVQ